MAPLPQPPTSAPPTNPPPTKPRGSGFLSSDEEPRRRVSRKLQKKHRDGHQTPTMELPERLKESTVGAEDEEDVRVPPQGGGMFMNMNQSIFGLIAAAGSTVDFNDRFEGQSSDEEDEGRSSSTTPRKDVGKEKEPTKPTEPKKPGSKTDSSGTGRHRRKLSERRLLRSLPSLTTKFSSKSRKASSSKAPQIKEELEPESPSPAADDSPSLELTRTNSRLPPVMSRMLEAKAEMASRPSFEMDRISGEKAHEGGAADTGPTALARKLVEIFEFDKPEEVIDEYPCWLLQSVLLQGYMYITARHICFYAYLPKKANEVVKSGYLSKSGKRNPKFNRYWFRLKGDVLAYYHDPAELYFPDGQIDLRYGISAATTDKDKDSAHFSVVTHHRSYHFKADSVQSAKEWVKSLQRVIFRSHNEGDSVKISLPIENVIDIEESQMVEFADTCKIRVIDNDETYAIDEYFFSFFDLGKEALNVLRILIEDTSQQADPNKLGPPTPHGDETRSNEVASNRTSLSGPLRIDLDKSRGAKLQDSVRATLSPASPGPGSARVSVEASRSSFDALRPFGRRSLDVNRALRDESPRRTFSDSRRSSRNRVPQHAPRAAKQDSSDSYVQSLEDPSLASVSALAAWSSDEPSASQILKGSDVFHSPTIRRSASASRQRDPDHVHHPHSHRTHAAKHPLSPGLPTYKSKHAATTGHVADPGAGEQIDPQPAPPTLRNLANMGSYPLQRAGMYAGWLNQQGRRMSNLLATESMGYVEKVSGMWKGGRKHYDEPQALRVEGHPVFDDEKAAESMDRFRAHFALPESERLQATYFGYLIRVLPLYGKIYISDRHFCFRSLLPGTRTKLILPLKDIENVDKEKGFRFGWSGLCVVIRRRAEMFFEFGQAETRDDCAITLLQNLEVARYLRESGNIGEDEKAEADTAMAERDALNEARQEERPDRDAKAKIAPCTDAAMQPPTVIFDDPKASFLNFKPPPLRITCLTIGSRGDVQPYIALCKGLLADGHKVRIATHPEFEEWIRGHGIDYGRVEGDPGELMKICIENGTFTWQFLKEANSKMRTWLDELLTSAWTACQGTDLLIESPSAMAGIHIAEKLQIPYFRAFTMPWTRTRAYPHAFVMPEHKMGGAYNYITYIMFDNIFWKATASQINRWRNKSLGLPNTTLEKMQPNKVPFLYNFSPSVVPPPLDFSDWIRVTGYWFLDEGNAKTPRAIEGGEDKTLAEPEPAKKPWTPPQDLTDFIAAARRDEKKVVYVGFGSILVPDPAKMTQEVIDAVLKADVRCILSKGWSDRMVTAKDKERAAQLAAEAEGRPFDPALTPAVPLAPKDSDAVDVPLPPEIFSIKSAPHDWLFAQIDAAAHHGGSGTTGASLRAGIPTIIRPFFGDQFFFGSRVEDLGVGICLKKWGAKSFARALWEATNSKRMINRARVLGEEIRKENGVDMAIQCLYRDLDYAKSLARAKAGKNLATQNADDADDEDEPEESWTFIGEDIGHDGMQQSVILSPSLHAGKLGEYQSDGSGLLGMSPMEWKGGKAMASVMGGKEGYF